MANTDVERELRRLSHDGFTIERARGGVTLVAPNGARCRVATGNFKAVRAWAEKEAKKPRRTERSDRGGVAPSHKAATRTSKTLDGVLSHWDRLPSDAQVVAIKEMLHRLSKAGAHHAAEALYLLERGE